MPLDQVRVEALPEVTVLGADERVTVGAVPVTVIVTVCRAVPPAPVQVSSYSVEFVSGPVGQAPLSATAPCQPPAAVQAVAFTAFQVSVELPPLGIVGGAADNITAGVAESTATLTDCVTVLPVPVQVKV